MKKLLIFVAALALAITMGCATIGNTPYEAPEICQDAESLILKKFPDPRGLDTGLLAVQLVALETVKGYNKDEAIKILNEIQDNISIGMTYADVVEYIQVKIDLANTKYGAALFIVGVDISILAEPLPISDCDIALVKKHMNKQIALIKIYNAE
jgi:hypothetical protein